MVTRRRVLRGMLNGAAVSVTLPLLNCFLNENGTAFASGAPIPVRFGTWTWGLGMSKDIFVPKRTGADFDLPPEIAPLASVQKHINLFTNFNVFKDAAPNLCHHTGWVILRSGIAPLSSENRPGETLDVTVSKKIGNATRFNNLCTNATGDVRDSFSYVSGNTVVEPEYSPTRLYQRLFGKAFQDPNAPTFTPDPKVMVSRACCRRWVRTPRHWTKSLGAEDRARLDQYFTGLRDVERRMDLQLTKPQPIAALPSRGTAAGRAGRPGCGPGLQASSPDDGHDADGPWPATRPASSACSTRRPSRPPRARATTSPTTRRPTRSRLIQVNTVSRTCPGTRSVPCRSGPTTCRRWPT